MKGHTDIILTDVRNGHVEHHSDDNMVTNALNYYFKSEGYLYPCAYCDISGTSSNQGSIFWQKNAPIINLLGGLLLFDKAQEENPDHIFASGGTHMIGNGAYETSTDLSDGVTEFGNFNANESGWDDNRKIWTQVWDFGTSQANGNIACACLTSRIHGYNGEGNYTSGKRKAEYNTNVYNFDKISDGEFVLYSTSNNRPYLGGGNDIPLFIKDEKLYVLVAHDNKYQIYSFDYPITKIDLRFYALEGNLEKDIADVIPDGYKNNVQYNGTERVIQTDTDVYVGLSGYYGKMIMLKISKADLITVCIDTETKNDFEKTQNLDSDFSSFINNDNRTSVYIGDNKIFYSVPYRRENGADLIGGFLKDLSTGTLTQLDGSWSQRLQQIQKDRIYIPYAIYDFVDDKMYPTNNCKSNNNENYCSSLYPSNPLFGITNGKNKVGFKSLNYLATINNLSTPVTKDNTRTMKVIYTLTFDD